MSKKVLVKVPASTANLGPGFDTLGMALELFAWVEMGIADRTRFDLIGPGLHGVPEDKSNLVYRVAQQVFAEAGVSHPELSIAMRSDIPLTRGLGSSASAIVAAMVAANALIGNPLSQDQLFQLATRLEKHPDNVGASLFGGIVVAFWDGSRAEYIRLQPDPRLQVLAVIPDFQLSTEKARDALPRQVSVSDAVFNVSHSSLLVAALSTGALPMLRHAMRDRLHQPYRAPLIPGMDKILSGAEEHGALGVALSGAGPTLLALVDRETPYKQKLEQYMLDTLQHENIRSAAIWLNPCSSGAEVLTVGDENSKLIENIKGEIRQ